MLAENRFQIRVQRGLFSQQQFSQVKIATFEKVSVAEVFSNRRYVRLFLPQKRAEVGVEGPGFSVDIGDFRILKTDSESLVIDESSSGVKISKMSIFAFVSVSVPH